MLQVATLQMVLVESGGGRYRFELIYAVQDADESSVTLRIPGSQKLVCALRCDRLRIDAVPLNQLIGAGPDLSLFDQNRQIACDFC